MTSETNSETGSELSMMVSMTETPGRPEKRMAWTNSQIALLHLMAMPLVPFKPSLRPPELSIRAKGLLMSVDSVRIPSDPCALRDVVLPNRNSALGNDTLEWQRKRGVHPQRLPHTSVKEAQVLDLAQFGMRLGQLGCS